MQIHPKIKSEYGRLQTVMVGIARDMGQKPSLHDCYDARSRESVVLGTFPAVEDCILQVTTLVEKLESLGIEVLMPAVLEKTNQIFTRDIAFVIDDRLIIANILEDRSDEIQALKHLLDKIPQAQIIQFPEDAHIEGGDVMPWGDYIFVGTYKEKDYRKYITARTNMAAVARLQELFPEKKVVSFSLKKSNFDPFENALHLDCCFQPLGRGKAIIHREGFLIESEYQLLIDFFGSENVFHVDKKEMYHMNCNVFSISPDVVVSERGFTRLNQWLRAHGFTVEEIPYGEIAKQEGLLRCSTMPLYRDPA